MASRRFTVPSTRQIGIIVVLLIALTSLTVRADFSRDETVKMLQESIRAVSELSYEGTGTSILGPDEPPAIHRIIFKAPFSFRIEPEPENPQFPFYLVERDRYAFRVERFVRRAYKLPPAFISQRNHLIIKTAVMLTQREVLKAEKVNLHGMDAILIEGPGPITIRIWLQDKNRFPLKTEVLKDGRLAAANEFTEIKFRKEKDLPDFLFMVPQNYLILPPLRRHRFGTKPNEPPKEGFLPLLPTFLPESYRVSSITPLIFKKRVIYHVRLSSPEHSSLISIFQSPFPGIPEKLTRRLLKEKVEEGEMHMVLVRKDGVVLLMIGNLPEEILRKIALSVEEDRERAIEILKGSELPESE